MTQRTSRPANSHASGAASVQPLAYRADQWLHDQHRHALKMARLQPHRAQWWRGRADAIRAELQDRADLRKDARS
jgi:hypothetical protein